MINKILLKTSLLALLALIAFAANSVLCRLALGAGVIDASSFTTIRLVSGAISLFLILSINGNKKSVVSKGSWCASLALFIYAVTFSYAYLWLDTGTGALVLFGSVQISMILLSLFSGTRLQTSEWLGLVMAFTGFVYLIIPNVTTPSFYGLILMSVAGVSWSVYTVKGRSSQNSLMDTSYNFLRTIPLVLVLAIVTMQHMNCTSQGVALAVLSGVVTSGLGCTIWYIALGGLSSTQAAVIQLSVPIIAAIGGVIFVSEAITARLIISASIVLGGIFLVVLGKYHKKENMVMRD